MTDAAKLIITVTAGVLPEQPDAQLTRRFTVSAREWEEAGDADDELAADDPHRAHRYLLLAFRAASADEYARLLRNPNAVNWVKTEWVWL